jgi:iron complex outermembrane receptor protein
MMTKKLACLASTALVGCLLSATAAMAQSTGRKTKSTASS